MPNKTKTRRTANAKRKRVPPREQRCEKYKGLGLQSKSYTQLNQMVHDGFDFALLEKFHQASGLSFRKITELIGVPKSGITRRRMQGRLGCNESDRLFRISRIFDLAVDLFEGDVSGARYWINTPQPALEGAIPLEFSSTDIGSHEVEKLITRLEHGVFV